MYSIVLTKDGRQHRPYNKPTAVGTEVESNNMNLSTKHNTQQT